MKDFFKELSLVDDPQKNELTIFIDESMRFLEFIIEDNIFLKRLWKSDQGLRYLAQNTFHEDIKPASEKIKVSIQNCSDEKLKEHGLVGKAVKFKYAVILKLKKLWEQTKIELTVGPRLKSLLEAIDVILDSIIAANGGVGEILKEFKDALSALVPSR